MAEQIKMLFGVNTFWGPWNIVLDVGFNPPAERGRGLAFMLWNPFISLERLKFGT